MRAFEVRLNGKKICLAGVGNDGVLSTIVNWVPRDGRGELSLDVGGLISSEDQHVMWIRQRRLRLGDRVEVTVVEKDEVDVPAKKKRRANPQQVLGEQKRYVRMMAKRFGWKIQVPKKAA